MNPYNGLNSQFDEDLRIGLQTICWDQLGCTVNSPHLIMLSGLPGTGKSFFANQLSSCVSSVVVSSDRVRKAMFRYPKYTRSEHARVFSVCHKMIEMSLNESRLVVFDATNLNESFRRPLYDMSGGLNCGLTILSFTASTEEIRSRLFDRSLGNHPDNYSDADWSIYEFLRDGQQAISMPHIIVESPKDNDVTLKHILTLLSQDS